MRFLLITTALLFSGHAQSDNFWLCASDDDPRSVIVSLPEKGAAAVQVGGSNSNVLATFEEEVDENGGRSLRFNFNNYESTLILKTSLKEKKKLKKGENNIVLGFLYDFSSVEDGELATGVTFLCLPRVEG
jgi:hypothetical protein